jgi:hypothetical protein
MGVYSADTVHDRDCAQRCPSNLRRDPFVLGLANGNSFRDRLFLEETARSDILASWLCA